MTYYFDSAHERVCKIQDRVLRILALEEQGQHIPNEDRNWIWNEELDRIENKLLFDVQLVATLPNFPKDLRDAMQVVIAKFASEPLYGINRWSSETEDQGFRRVHDLIWNLHSIFHDLGQRQLPEFSDKPDSILAARAATLEDRRLELMRAHPEFSELVQTYEDEVVRLQEEMARP